MVSKIKEEKRVIPKGEDILRILYFDTTAVVKYYIEETGSEIVRKIVDNSLTYNCRPCTSQITLTEFPKVLKKKGNKPKSNPEFLDEGKRKSILSRFRRTVKQLFTIVDEGRITKKYNWSTLQKKYNLTEGDARHYAAMLNHLGFFAGESKVKFVCSDNELNKIVEKDGYKIINPCKMSISNLEKILEE